MEDGSNTTTGLEEADNSLDDPECREDSEDESGDMNEACRPGVRDNKGKGVLETLYLLLER